VVSATDPHGRNLGFLDPEPLLFLSSSSSIILTRLSGPRSSPKYSYTLYVSYHLSPPPLDYSPKTYINIWHCEINHYFLNAPTENLDIVRTSV
jgi:hypothetical protein